MDRAAAAGVLGAMALGLGLSRCLRGTGSGEGGSADDGAQGKSDELLPDALNRKGEGEIAAAQQKLKELTRDAGDADEPPTPVPAAYSSGLPTRRTLTEAEREAYARDGFVVCRGWFSPEEVDVLHATIRADHAIDEQKISVKDTEGRDTKLTLWWFLGDDTYGQFGRSASLVEAVASLMGGSEPYHSHSKVLLKEPHSGGAWEWHQDFGYWYDQGLLHPDKIVNAIIALDPNTPENGCMRLMRRSHTLGRVDHGTFGGQAGADPTRVVAAMQLPGYDVVRLPLMPGGECSNGRLGLTCATLTVDRCCRQTWRSCTPTHSTHRAPTCRMTGGETSSSP